jgi:hypothetical protein
VLTDTFKSLPVALSRFQIVIAGGLVPLLVTLYTMKYVRGKIYGICSESTKEVYIGSTTQELEQCLYNMRKKPNKDEVRQIIYRKDTFIRLLRLAICDSKDELKYELHRTINEHIEKNYEVLNIPPKPEAPNQLTPIVCVCGVSTSKSNMCRHLKSAKHISHMNATLNTRGHPSVDPIVHT